MVDNPFHSKSEAARYRRFRPHYHDVPFKMILKFNGHPFRKALDVACGTGHSTVSLSKIADEVIGVDISGEMISEALQAPNVSYEEADAINLPYGKGAFDIVNISMGIHWVDHKKFVSEAARVLETEGILSVDNYGFKGVVSDDPGKQKLHRDFFEKYMPSPEKYDHLPENGILEKNKFKLVKEISYDKRITMDSDYFQNFLMTTSNFQILKEEAKIEVEEMMSVLYDDIFDDGTINLRFGGLLKLFKRYS